MEDARAEDDGDGDDAGRLDLADKVPEADSSSFSMTGKSSVAPAVVAAPAPPQPLGALPLLRPASALGALPLVPGPGLAFRCCP